MLIRNMFTPAVYGRELNTTWAPAAEKSYESDQGPSADPLDSPESFNHILLQQTRAAEHADSTKAHIDAIRDVFGNLESSWHQAEKTIFQGFSRADPQAVSPGDQHSDILMVNGNGTLSLLQSFDAPDLQEGKKSINFAALFGVPSESGKSLDIKAHPDVRKSFDTYLSEHQKDLPRLTPEKYEAVSGATSGKDGRPAFNCIANSVRNEKEIIEPRVFVDKFDEFYGEHGYKPLDTLDYSLQEGVEKVVLYGFTPSDGNDYEIRRGAWGPDYRNYQGPLCYTPHGIN